MTVNHHLLAQITTDSILKKFKEGDWKCCGNIGKDFIKSPVEASHPSPDVAFYDNTNEIRVVFEFKPPTENKRGILTGLGQSVAYLNNSSISYLIIPKKLQDFDLQDYMKNIFEKQVVGNLPIGLIVFDNDHPSEVSMIHNVKNLLNGKKKIQKIKSNYSGRFWAKHVDLPLPLFHLILHCYYLKKTNQIKDDPLAYCWKTFCWNTNSLRTLVPTEVKDIRGEVIMTPAGRKKIAFLEDTMKKIKPLKGQQRQKAIEKLKEKVKTTDIIGENYYKSVLTKNFKPFLQHVGVVAGGDLTDYGVKLYHLGVVHGPNSRVFQDYYLKTILEKGHHLDLIFDMDRLCNEYRGKKTTEEIKQIMEDQYGKEGKIRRNKGRQKKQKSKVKFLKYELILWGSFSLLGRIKAKPDLSFNWKKITDVCSLPELL